MEGNQRGLCAEQAVPICGTAPPPGSPGYSSFPGSHRGPLMVSLLCACGEGGDCSPARLLAVCLWELLGLRGSLCSLPLMPDIKSLSSSISCGGFCRLPLNPG